MGGLDTVAHLSRSCCGSCRDGAGFLCGRDCIHLSLRRFILTDFKSDLQHGRLVIINAHLSIILIVLLVLKKCDPLVVCVQTTVQNDELRDGNAAYVFGQTSSLTDESDAIGRHLLRQGHRRRCLLRLTHVLCV